jgi:hypothetical protein
MGFDLGDLAQNQSVQGAGHEPGCLGVFQSGGFGTETKTFCVLFFVN